MSTVALHDDTLLPAAEWQRLKQQHEERIGPFIEQNLHRRAAGTKHPVYDFLFEYYSFRPSKLRRWVPGAGRWLQGPAAAPFLDIQGFVVQQDCTGLPVAAFPEKRRSSLHWVIRLLESIGQRPAQFACMGLHEWAMVYDDKDVRHPGLPLRVTEAERRAVVDANPLCCSHFDAFRFFSQSAQPRNRWALTQESRMDREQGGCLHVNMDLYKWSYKFYPWVSSELLADSFLLAIEARELDMRASPYDVRELGLSPVYIEQSDGRMAYMEGQRDIAERGTRLRTRLLEELRRLDA